MNDREDGDRWYRSKIAARIPPRYRGTRATAFVVLGTLKIAGTGVRVAAMGIRNHRRRKRPTRPAGTGSFCVACGLTFRTVGALNAHYYATHTASPGPSPATSGRRDIRRPPGTRRTSIRPAGRPANRGSVVASVVDPPNPRTRLAAQKYREHTDKLGERNMATEDSVGNYLARAASALDDLNPRGRIEMYDTMAGLEKGLARLSEAVTAYRDRLKREHPRGVDVRGPIAAELVNPHFRKIVDGLEQAGEAATGFVAGFEDINGLAIRVAQGNLPNGGTRFLAG